MSKKTDIIREKAQQYIEEHPDAVTVVIGKCGRPTTKKEWLKDWHVMYPFQTYRYLCDGWQRKTHGTNDSPTGVSIWDDDVRFMDAFILCVECMERFYASASLAAWDYEIWDDS